MRDHTPPGYLLIDWRFPGDITKHVLHDDGHIGPYTPPPIPSPLPERTSDEQNPIRA